MRSEYRWSILELNRYLVYENRLCGVAYRYLPHYTLPTEPGHWNLNSSSTRELYSPISSVRSRLLILGQQIGFQIPCAAAHCAQRRLHHVFPPFPLSHHQTQTSESQQSSFRKVSRLWCAPDQLRPRKWLANPLHDCTCGELVGACYFLERER